MEREPICDICLRENVDNSMVSKFAFVVNGEEYSVPFVFHWHSACKGIGGLVDKVFTDLKVRVQNQANQTLQVSEVKEVKA